MKTRKSYTAPDMKVMSVGTEQILAGSPDGVTYEGKNSIGFSNEETDGEATAKRSTGLWDEDE